MKQPGTPPDFKALTKAVQEKIRWELGINPVVDPRKDQSLAKALLVLKEMKTAGCTWQEMANRVEQEFETKLDKDQLKALVR